MKTVLLDSFLLSLNAILSIFVMMAVGYCAKRLLHLEKEHIGRFNSLVFYTLLPLMLFHNIYRSDIRAAVNFRCLGLALSVLAVLFALTWIFVKRVEPENSQRGVMIQASFRSNFLLLGTPLIQELCPDADLATVSVMLAIVVPCFNVLAVVTLETFSRRNLAICTAFRLLIYPGAALSLGALAGLRGPEFAVLISMFATPAAVSSFSMAAQMGGDPELAASAVTVTTLLSAATMFLWIFLFKSLGMF